MIALIYRLKSGRVQLVMKNVKNDTQFAKDVESVSAAQEIMHRVSSDWELAQEIKIYQIKPKLISQEEVNDKGILSSL